MSQGSSALEAISRRLRVAGFAVREASFFATQGIGVSHPSFRDHVAEAMVFIYPRDGVWQMRLTRHGGQHWTRNEPELADVEALTKAFLIAPRWPPGAGWTETE